ncbi:MAG TPA: hypothetical protein PLJ35_21835 [Anaerolineae bacterium]|nr:hypothetical protein [Anaerolineae bacterium]HPL27320.1 hypothetical protein [Anaerolineae bacterium]HPL27327.1 hypothetical protein [Anaerolineae bacterium]
MSSSRLVRTLARASRLVLALACAIGLVLGAAPLQRAQASSGIVFDGSPGTGAPPPTLGPYDMIPFPADGRPLHDSVTTVPGPTGDLSFSCTVRHQRIGSGWATWSHGYKGDVYWGEATEVTMSLPPATHAFYFYVEPNPFDEHHITATAQDGTTSGPIAVHGSAGAAYFGFYSTGAPLATITVSSSVDFALGEFGIFGIPSASEEPPICVRADVAVVIYGGWDGIAVNAYVGGTKQETLYTARDAFGEAAVLWTFYPPDSGWSVSVAPATPPGKDPQRWRYKLVRIEPDGDDAEDSAGAGATIYPCSEHVFYFQLVDTGALPNE